MQTINQSILKGRVWNRYFVSVFIYAMLCQFTMTVTNYSLPLQIVNQMHYSAVWTGYLSTLFAAGSMVCRFATGNLCDRKGRRIIMIIGAAIIAVSMFIMGFTTSIVVILGFKVVQGVGHAMQSTASNAAAADTVPSEHYAEGIGYYAMASTIVGAIGATIVIALMSVGHPDGDNYVLPMIVAGLCGIVALLLGWSLNYEKKMNFQRVTTKKKFDIHDYIEVKALLPTILVMAQCLCTGSGMFLLLYANECNLAAAMGIYYVISTVISVGTRFTFGRVMGKIKPQYVIIAGVLLQISGYVAIAVHFSIVTLYYSAVASGLAGAVLQPVLNTLALKSAPASRSGAASATYWLGFDIGMAITPVVFGLVVDAAGYSASFLIGAACMFIFVIIAAIALRKVKPLDLIEQPAED